MKPFKISLKELIILIILSIPIGTFLYINNYKKINYVVKAKRGFAISENFCENHSYTKPSLLREGDIDLVYQNIVTDSSIQIRLFMTSLKSYAEMIRILMISYLKGG